MNELKEKKLQNADVDIKGGVNRFAGNVGMYERFIDKFPSEPTYGRLQSAMEQEDWEEAQLAAHTLKGVAGNLGMSRLSLACSDVVGHLRSGEQEKAVQAFEILKAVYEEMIRIIQPQEGEEFR